MPKKTVSDVMQDVFEASKFKCLPYEKRNLDEDPNSEYREYDDRIPGRMFENPETHKISPVRATGVDETVPTILTYFMDGSRRVFRFSDVILPDGRYYPVLAGQVGVAVLKRADDRSINPMRKYVCYENILVFPDTIRTEDQEILRAELANGNLHFHVAAYQTGNIGADRSNDFISTGTKKILDLMHDLELDAVNRMMADRDLRDDAMLVVDGSLQFRQDVLQRNKFPINQLANVIGISKSFTPSQPVIGAPGSKHLGTFLQNLEYGERTPVFKAGHDEFESVLGVWYLRIRRRPMMTNPLAGIIKIEALANGDEIENGIDRDRVDHLSALVLSERNVTPYGSDNRWANHIYPIYLTELYLKSGFRSDVYFKGLL